VCNSFHTWQIQTLDWFIETCILVHIIMRCIYWLNLTSRYNIIINIEYLLQTLRDLKHVCQTFVSGTLDISSSNKSAKLGDYGINMLTCTKIQQIFKKYVPSFSCPIRMVSEFYSLKRLPAWNILMVTYSTHLL